MPHGCGDAVNDRWSRLLRALTEASERQAVGSLELIRRRVYICL